MSTGSRNRRKNLIGLLLAPAVLFVMLRWFERSQVYHPSSDWWATGDRLGRPWEDLTFLASDGVRLSAWFFPARADSPRRDWAVLICHGNGGNISHRLDLYRVLLGLGVNVLAFDYRGYGRSAGRPSESGTYLDAQAGYAWLRARGFVPDRLIVYGESLGGGVAAELARRERVAALILQSSFTSIPDLGVELFPWLPVRWIATIQYNTRSKLPHLQIPVLILHSRADQLIPFHHAEENLAAANPPKELIEIDGDHNDALEVSADRLAIGLEAFLKRLAVAAPLPAEAPPPPTAPH